MIQLDCCSPFGSWLNWSQAAHTPPVEVSWSWDKLVEQQNKNTVNTLFDKLVMKNTDNAMVLKNLGTFVKEKRE